MSKTTISPNIGNISGVLTPLIPFDCIFDLDFGLLRLIRFKYFDTDIFSKDFFENNDSVVDILSRLYLREHQNPLLMILKEQNVEVAQSLYDDFISKRYEEIVNLSMSTEIFELIRSFLYSGEIKPTIVYRNEIELQFLKGIHSIEKVNKISIDNLLKQDNFNLYQQFFFKDIDNYYLNKLKDHIKSCTVYIGGYKYCCNENDQILLNYNTGQLSMDKNSIVKIDIYNKRKLKER